MSSVLTGKCQVSETAVSMSHLTVVQAPHKNFPKDLRKYADLGWWGWGRGSNFLNSHSKVTENRRRTPNGKQNYTTTPPGNFLDLHMTVIHNMWHGRWSKVLYIWSRGMVHPNIWFCLSVGLTVIVLQSAILHF